VLSVLSRNAASKEGMSAEQNKAIMRQYFEGAWEQGNLELLDELLAPDYVNHNPATPGMPTGPEGVKGVVSMFRSGMPDLKVVIEDMIAEGEKVATRYTLEGTPTKASSLVSPHGPAP
jgi:predicted ester cyclase